MIHVRGTHPTQFLEIDALLDTGFTGFLMLPIAKALPLGLALYGTGDYNLADGSPISWFLAEGTVEIRPPSPTADRDPTIQPETEIATGAVVLGGDDALLGMEFIKALKKWLLVGSVVMLIDEDSLDLPIMAVPN
jgi:hypothetical protein